ncbi:MAG: accessory factor UbiK family protein [Cycloclasticus sp.]|jgi:BMFP domain-containing protein YqiC|nr:accessory factor UbiK family protein [Cycloclasticus sp.]
MINSNVIESLAQSLSDHLPQSLSSFKDEAEKNFKLILQQQFTKLDLVTREEFDTQNAVLLRTREKLEELEKLLTELSTKK